MVTTNCQELTGKGDCTVPLSGKTAQELQQNVFQHAQQDHADIVKAMSPADQSKMIKRIQEVYNQKAGMASRS
jgi:hypothetical protein